jgi:hypothetical protein
MRTTTCLRNLEDLDRLGEITWGTAVATLAVPFVFLLPGWALLSLFLPPERFPPERRPDVIAWFALAAGLTLALAPIALLFLRLFGLKAGTELALATLVLSALLVVWRRGRIWLAWWQSPLSWRERLAWLDAPLLAFLGVMLLVVGVRLWVVRGLNVGFWADSYHHTMITQLLLDNGGLFDSWEPYARLQSFTYHYGFHANVAWFQWATGWLTGNPTPRTVVLVAQFLNALAAIALYPLAVRLSGGNRWTGVIAVLIAGLLTPVPMFYVNWGRYSQMIGQAILPIAIWFTAEVMETRQRDPRRMVLAILTVAGLALTHYFVLAFYVLFLVPYLAFWVARHWQEGKLWREGLLRVFIIGVGSILLILPWIVHLLDGLLPHILAGFLQGTPSDGFIQQSNQFFPLNRVVPRYLTIMALLGGLWALVRRRSTAILLLWVGCLFLLSNPYRLGLPGTGVVNNFTVALSLYIPAAILAADLIVSIFGYSWQHWTRLRPVLGLVAGILMVVVALAGVRQQADIIVPHRRLVTPADEVAMSWVRRNVPEEARFLVNSQFEYDDTMIVGLDAGWWLPLLTGRDNTVPPMMYGSEVGPDPGYRESVNEITLYVEQNGLEGSETARYLNQQGISHIFVGERGGPLLDIDVLQASPYYHAIYQPPGEAPGPWVFEIASP